MPTPPASPGSPKSSGPGIPIPRPSTPRTSHYDPKSDPSNPTWYQVSIKGVRAIDPPLDLTFLNAVPELAGMELLRKGSRLSVQPVTESQWKTILSLAKSKTRR